MLMAIVYSFFSELNHRDPARMSRVRASHLGLGSQLMSPVWHTSVGQKPTRTKAHWTKACALAMARPPFSLVVAILTALRVGAGIKCKNWFY